MKIKRYIFAAVPAVALMVGAVAVVGTSAKVVGKSAMKPIVTAQVQQSVGQVVSISSGSLLVNDNKTGKLQTLHALDSLQLGDMVFASRGIKASLKLMAPKGISDDPEIIFIRPLIGKRYPVNVNLQRRDDGSIDVTLSS